MGLYLRRPELRAGRRVTTGTDGTVQLRVAPLLGLRRCFRNILLPCIRDAPTLPLRHVLYHTPRALTLIG